MSCNSLLLLVPPARFEHAAYGLGIRRSIHLSYGGVSGCRLVDDLLSDVKR